VEGRVLVSQAVVKRVGNLERVFAVGAEDCGVDCVMWVGNGGGVFGHAHFTVYSHKATVIKPCSEEEELEIMRAHYEGDGHRLYEQGAEVSFADYLERFSYLGPEELAEKRRLIIERVRSGVDGA